MNNDSALARGIRTFLQAVIGTVIAIWSVPGVPEVVGKNLLSSIVAIGVPTGLVSFVWNVLRKDVPNV
jgi:hypothetical protein